VSISHLCRSLSGIMRKYLAAPHDNGCTTCQVGEDGRWPIPTSLLPTCSHQLPPFGSCKPNWITSDRPCMECILDPLSAKIKAKKGKLVGKSITTQKWVYVFPMLCGTLMNLMEDHN
jgi:hypothetical protein